MSNARKGPSGRNVTVVDVELTEISVTVLPIENMQTVDVVRVFSNAVGTSTVLGMPAGFDGQEVRIIVGAAGSENITFVSEDESAEPGTEFSFTGTKASTQPPTNFSAVYDAQAGNGGKWLATSLSED